MYVQRLNFRIFEDVFPAAEHLDIECRLANKWTLKCQTFVQHMNIGVKITYVQWLCIRMINVQDMFIDYRMFVSSGWMSNLVPNWTANFRGRIFGDWTTDCWLFFFNDRIMTLCCMSRNLKIGKYVFNQRHIHSKVECRIWSLASYSAENSKSPVIACSSVDCRLYSG